MQGSDRVERDTRKLVARMRDTDRADREWENARRRTARKVERRASQANRRAMELAAAMEEV
jgi:hypothetical protein